MTSLPRDTGSNSFASFDLSLPASSSTVSMMSSISSLSSISIDEGWRGAMARGRKTLATRKNRWQTGKGTSGGMLRAPRRQQSNPFLQETASSRGLVIPRRKRSNPSLASNSIDHEQANMTMPRRKKSSSSLMRVDGPEDPMGDMSNSSHFEGQVRRGGATMALQAATKSDDLSPPQSYRFVEDLLSSFPVPPGKVGGQGSSWKLSSMDLTYGPTTSRL